MSWRAKLARLIPSLPWRVGLASCFVYGGAVNLGWSDCFFALPMVVYLIIVFRRHNTYRLPIAAIFSLCAVLYGLKTEDSRLYHPAIGRTFVVLEEVCAVRFIDDSAGIQIRDGYDECSQKKQKDYVVKTAILPAHSHFPLTRVCMNHADFGERYWLCTQSELGKLQIDATPDEMTPAIRWENGETIQERDLRRGIFYLPSLLMYWLMLPVLLSNFLSYPSAWLSN